MKGLRGCAPGIACLCLALLLSACAGEHETPVTAEAAPMGPRPGPSAHYFSRADEASPARVRAEIVRWFTKAGYKSFQAEALAEHAKIESGFRPCASPRSSLRYTYQWGGLRLQRLDRFADAHGGCPPLEKQLAFADTELRGQPAFSCFWSATTASGALAALRRGFGQGRC